eukprot:COSAG06_NODE_13578_length_1243_cov_1.007867_1_plen_274_part_00
MGHPCRKMHALRHSQLYMHGAAEQAGVVTTDGRRHPAVGVFTQTHAGGWEVGTLHGSQLFERETALIAREAQIGEREAALTVRALEVDAQTVALAAKVAETERDRQATAAVGQAEHRRLQQQVAAVVRDLAEARAAQAAAEAECATLRQVAQAAQEESRAASLSLQMLRSSPSPPLHGAPSASGLTWEAPSEAQMAAQERHIAALQKERAALCRRVEELEQPRQQLEGGAAVPCLPSWVSMLQALREQCADTAVMQTRVMAKLADCQALAGLS